MMPPTATHVLVVAAQADADQFVPPGSPNRWCAIVCDESRLSGLFAHGDTLHDARTALAAAVWLAARNDPTIDTANIDAVRILTVTRKTFDVTALDVAAAIACPYCGAPLDPISGPHNCPPQTGS